MSISNFATSISNFEMLVSNFEILISAAEMDVPRAEMKNETGETVSGQTKSRLPDSRGSRLFYAD